MERLVEPEWLDHLSVNDPGAIGSRRDLKRLNAWMGHAAILAKTLQGICPRWTPRRIVELGAGDGDFLLTVAQRCRNWGNINVVLVDRHSVVSDSTRQRFSAMGWITETIQADALDWLEKSSDAPDELIVANLFLHHFERALLARLLRLVSEHAGGFIAVEPRRSSWSFCFSRMVRLIGCNSVTGHDAPISVKAGFKKQELTQLWPDHAGWRLRETEAGLFSHVFAAVRVSYESPRDGSS